MATAVFFKIISCIIFSSIEIAGASVGFQYGKVGCYEVGEKVLLIGSYSGAETVSFVQWTYDKKSSGNMLVNAASCNVFGGPLDYPNYPKDRMTFTCDNVKKEYNATIDDIKSNEDGDVWGVTFTLSGTPDIPDRVEDTLKICEECNITEVVNGYVNATQSSVIQGTLVVVTCDDGYMLDGKKELTCQSDGSWNFPWPECLRTTTTTTTATTTTTTSSTTTATTTITSPATIMTASSATATTTSSVLTTKTIVTASPTASSTFTSTNSTGKAPSTSRDKALVTMIIVVSVIGGVLIVAIFSVMCVIMHWKSCFSKMTHTKQYIQKSDHRKQHRQAENNASGRFFTTQQDHAMRGYYFYNGTFKNPLFCDPFENSFIMNYYPKQKNSHDPKYMSSYKTYQYNYDGDYNWDLQPSY